jgi:hypothetical protein
MDVAFLLPFYKLMKKTTDVAIMKHLFWISANLFSEPNSKIIFAKIDDISNYVLELFALDNLHINLKETLLWLIGVMFKTEEKTFIEKARNYVDIILKYIRVTFNSGLFSEALDTVYRMVECQDDYIMKCINKNKDVPNLLVSYISTETSHADLHNIFKIAEVMTIHSYEFADGLRDAGMIANSSIVFENLVSEYLEKRKKVTKECMLSILNAFKELIDTNKRNANDIIRHTDIPRSLVSLVGLNNIELNNAIWPFLNQTVAEGDTRVGTEILRFNILETVCQSLKETSDSKSTLLCLTFIKTLLHHGTVYLKGINVVKNQMEQSETDTFIEKLTLSHDKEVSSLAIEICEIYFK